MTETSIINLVDRCGGLVAAFEEGLVPSHSGGGLRPILDEAYDAYLVLKSKESTFYDYAENCGFEE